MRVAKNDYDDRAGLRGYVHFNKYTHARTHTSEHNDVRTLSEGRMSAYTSSAKKV